MWYNNLREVAMKVMSFNIQHGLDYQNQVIDLPLFADFIGKQGVDICGLNEVRGEGPWEGYTDQTNALGDALSMNRYFGEAIKVVGTNPYGNAFLSRFPIKEATVVHVPDPEERGEDVHYEHRCALRAVLDVCGRDLLLVVCHMGLARSEAENAVQTVCRILDECDLPAIVMGDFNHTLPEGILAPLLERLSDTDEISEQRGTFTFPSYGPKVKIDYIFCRKLRCKNAYVIEEIVSDHFPVVADLEFE